MKAKRDSRRGFTILELLVVIFIMMAMTGIAVAAFRGFLDTERIKLAGGQVVSSIRMARQYAMSKRTKVMVELLDSDPTTKEETRDIATIAQGYVFYQTDTDEGDNWNSGVMTALIYKKDEEERFKQGFAQFDLSSLVDAEVVEATLNVNQTGCDSDARSRGITFYIKSIIADDWPDASPDPDRPSWNDNLTAYKALGSFRPTTTGAQVHAMDVTEQVIQEIAGNQKFSIGMYSGGAANNKNEWLSANVTLEVIVDVPTGIGEQEGDIAARLIRIIPYLRVRNKVTGGYSWMVDQDHNALRTMHLPRNIHYVLTPRKLAVEQYDPVEGSVTVRKIFLALQPDGTCVAYPPRAVGWTDDVNTIFLRDANNDDLALLYVPPSSSFTRQRYLFGDEVEAFIAAHSLYSLW